MKQLGKAAWTGAYRLPTDRKDQRKTKRTRRRREKRAWQREEKSDGGDSVAQRD